MTATVEILLSTYNGEAYLEQQIKSIIDQSYQDWRIIARDDGSHDATVSILQKYSRLLGDRVYIAGRCGRQSRDRAELFATYQLF